MGGTLCKDVCVKFTHDNRHSISSHYEPIIREVGNDEKKLSAEVKIENEETCNEAEQKYKATIEDEQSMVHEATIEDESSMVHDATIEDEPSMVHEATIEDEVSIVCEETIKDEPPIV